MIIFIPTWLWLVLIPANYLIDRIVLKWSLGDMPDKGLFCRKHTWKICLAGFLSDFLGALVMFSVYIIGVMIEDGAEASKWLEELQMGVGFNPFSNLLSLIVVIFAIAVAGAIIYLLDRLILKRAGLDALQAKKSALRLAIITAPYLFLFPSSLIYNSSSFIL